MVGNGMMATTESANLPYVGYPSEHFAIRTKDRPWSRPNAGKKSLKPRMRHTLPLVDQLTGLCDVSSNFVDPPHPLEVCAPLCF